MSLRLFSLAVKQPKGHTFLFATQIRLYFEHSILRLEDRLNSHFAIIETASHFIPIGWRKNT